jgi:hypothetical protein
MPYNQLTNLDYFDIKNALRDYLRANSDFSGYEFEGSVLGQLLDVLAYNTYYTAFNTNMVANEMFLDSATLRDNVVAVAKQLGYQPRSAKCAEADLNITFTINSSSPVSTIVFRKGSGFITTIDNSLYQFILQSDYKAPVVNNTAIFDNVKIYEGTIVKSFYNVTQDTPSIIIDNVGIDTSTLSVKVYESQSSSTSEIYTPADNILTTTPQSKVFFVTEIEDENYRVTFGDGILGKKLTPGQYVEISYVITSGDVANGAKTFTFNGILEDENGNTPFNITNYTYTLNSASFNGASIESIDSIKKNAPAMYGTQNRAVTSDDYSAIVRRIYPAVADVYSYGGEESVPPEYGKVKIVVKPSNAAFLTSYTKNQIIQEIRKFSVASVVPEIVDASILYVEMDSKIYYNPSLTNKTAESIKSLAISNIENYINTSDTEKFGGKFRYSRFVSAIDSSDKSIRSNLTTIIMRKDFYPSLNNKTYYEICFNNPFDYDTDQLALSSTGFVVQEFPAYTSYIEDRDGKVILYRLDSQTGTKITINPNIGTINYATGEIRLINLTIIKGSFNDNKIEIRLRPQNNDIYAVRESFLDVDITKSKFTIIQE